LFLYKPVKYLMDMSDRPSVRHVRLSVMSLYDRFSPLSIIYDNPNGSCILSTSIWWELPGK
jgi:hypothetical protein